MIDRGDEGQDIGDEREAGLGRVEAMRAGATVNTAGKGGGLGPKIERQAKCCGQDQAEPGGEAAREPGGTCRGARADACGDRPACFAEDVDEDGEDAGSVSGVGGGGFSDFRFEIWRFDFCGGML